MHGCSAAVQLVHVPRVPYFVVQVAHCRLTAQAENTSRVFVPDAEALATLNFPSATAENTNLN